MPVLEDDGVKAECVVTDEGDGIPGLKNLAVKPAAFPDTIWSRTFSPATTTAPSASAGCRWIWSICKERYEKRSACEHSAFC